MKYFLIPYIALGLMLAMPIGVSYYCSGTEMFPEYFGSPFVFRRKSLGSSMTYFYSVLGVILNLFVWAAVVALVRLLLIRLQQRFKNEKTVGRLYKGIVIGLTLFSSFMIYMNYVTMGSGFEKGRNYWYTNMDEEAEKWGMECGRKWGMFGN